MGGKGGGEPPGCPIRPDGFYEGSYWVPTGSERVPAGSKRARNGFHQADVVRVPCGFRAGSMQVGGWNACKFYHSFHARRNKVQNWNVELISHLSDPDRCAIVFDIFHISPNLGTFLRGIIPACLLARGIINPFCFPMKSRGIISDCLLNL